MFPSALRSALPNFLSMSRLLAVPLAIWLMLSGHMTGAFWVFVLAGVTDALDGFFARQFGVRSVLGSYLDPIADKALLMSAYVTLGLLGHVESWLVILVVFRDLLIMGGALLFLVFAGSLYMRPLLISKVNTTAQILLAALVLARLGLGLDDGGLAGALVYVVAATTFASGAAYLALWGLRLVRWGDFR